MSLHLKYISIIVTRFIFSVIKIFPVNRDKIIFTSFGGIRISCNPWYIYNELISRSKNYKLYWVVTDENELVGKEYQIKYGTMSYIYHMLTAACVITNDTLPSYLPFRKKQLVVNTWHGGGLFKQTYGNCSVRENAYNQRVNMIHNNDIKLYTISSEAWCTQVVRHRFGYRGEVLNCGMPRNDIFFDNRLDEAFIKVRKFYNINELDAILLYAPTFRGSSTTANNCTFNNQPIDIKSILECLSNKYNKKFHFIFRGHHAMKASLSGCIDASLYPDMQELLAAADIFISDYSSCLWDYALTRRPIFLYAPDFDEYSQKPGFESDYNDWPFIICRSNSELIENINIFNSEKFTADIDRYLSSYGSYEDGNASKKVVDYIIKKLN